MTEASGEDAHERRRMAREEILRRGALFEARRRKKQTSPPNSFDSLVDENGNLRNHDLLDMPPEVAKSTGVDLSAEPSQPEKQNPSTPVEGTDKDRLHIDLPHSPLKSRSETLVELTPTSEAPDTPFDTSAHETPSGATHDVPQPGSEGEDWPSSGSTADENSQIYYAHPDPSSNGHQDLGSPFANLQSTSPTSATAGSYSHLDDLEDAVSDGTLSDLGQSSAGVATPASWSEIGSVISSDDGHYQ